MFGEEKEEEEEEEEEKGKLGIPIIGRKQMTRTTGFNPVNISGRFASIFKSVII